MNSDAQDWPTWSSPTAFVLAATAAVVGLGNVWRLPFLAGQYGGGAFLIVYGAALLVMALPLLMAELALGRGVRADVVTMLRRWARTCGLSDAWGWVGYLCLVAPVAVLSYYSVIAGWSMAYLLRSSAGVLGGLDAVGLRHQFVALVGDPEKGLGWHTMFMVAAGACVGAGVRRGVEPATRWLLAGAFAALLALVIVAVTATDQAGPALMYLVHTDFAALGWRGTAVALYQAFFSLSLGVGVMLAFGSYLRADTSLLRVGLLVVLLDTVFALIAGFVVVALLFAAHAQPVAGLQLVFKVFPAAAAKTGGGWVTTLFFFMLLMVTLSSAVGLLEPVVVWLMSRFRLSRVAASTVGAATVWFLGLGTLLSFNVFAQFTLFDSTFFDWLSLLSARVLLPLIGLLLCLFAGRYLPLPRLRRSWGSDRRIVFLVWRWFLRYPARLGLIVVALYSIGVLGFLGNLW